MQNYRTLAQTDTVQPMPLEHRCLQLIQRDGSVYRIKDRGGMWRALLPWQLTNQNSVDELTNQSTLGSLEKVKLIGLKTEEL